MATTEASSTPLTAVRFKLGADEAAPQPDPLGRVRIGYAAGLSTAELWERGRGVWKAKLATVADCDLVILAHSGVVVLVGTVDGVTFADDRIAVTGTPDPTHPLIGQPDPLDNASRNPVTYGTVHTLRPAVRQRPYGSVLSDAIRVLTEAARLRRPATRVTETGKVEPDPYRTELGDFPEFVTLALAGAVANVGGVYHVLAGRPGSWEAAGVESLLDSTVGVDGEDLWRHRTEPIRFTAHVPAVIAQFADEDTSFFTLEDELDRQEQAEQDEIYKATNDEGLYWIYDLTTPGDPVPLSPDAPAWSWEDYRARLADDGRSPDKIAVWEAWIRGDGEPPFPGLERTRYMSPRDAAAEATIAALERRAVEIDEKYAGLRDELAKRRLAVWAEYGEALRVQLDRAVAALPGLNVPIEISVDATTEEYEIGHDYYSLEWRLLEEAASRIGSGSAVR